MATENRLMKPRTGGVGDDTMTFSPATTSTGDFLSEYRRKPSSEEKATSIASSRTYPLFDGSRFENPWPSGQQRRFQRTINFFSRAGRAARRPLPADDILESALPLRKPNFLIKADNTAATTTSTTNTDDRGHDESAPLELTWIGHATTVLSIDGLTVLTDPIFSDYCAPVSVETFRRYRQIPCTINELPDSLKLVLISHNHYDHLDHQSIVELHRRYGDKLTFCVPKGLAEWFRQSIADLRLSAVVEMNWWQSAKFDLLRHDKNGDTISGNNNTFEIVCAPDQHKSWRNPFNSNKSLWCSWVVIGPSGRRFFFGGDTGYCSVFKEIGAELGPFDLATLPIGAYHPGESLRPNHVNPAEAVEIHLDVGSKKSVGVHWGTFQLGAEDALAPLGDLAAALAARNVARDAFVTIAHGETLIVPKRP